MTPRGDDDDAKERIQLIKSANHLSMAFASWAIVVVVIGTLSLYMLKRLMDGQDVMRGVDAAQSAQIAVMQSQFNTIDKKLDRIEDRQERINGR